MKPLRWTIVIALVAFLAGLAGVFMGHVMNPAAQTQGGDLHKLLHHQLKLDAAQEARVDALERRFAIRRRALELEVRAANARLAGAIEAEHGNGPQVAAAVDASHLVMGKLQKETLAHVFAMRQILKPDQARTFDQAVVKALTVDAR